MNDRCAAGTGRFLELVAVRLGIDLDSLGSLAAGAAACSLTSTCAVFAESEITGLLASGVEAPSIAGAVEKSVAERLAVLAGRRPWGAALFTGGVALVPGMRESLEARLGVAITVPRYPQEASAIGAALIALADGTGGRRGAPSDPQPG
jgi:predicted CoA-substrate-specific enzyme activase